MSYFFTQSQNFSDAVNGDVDPRTGLFNINISLGELTSNNQLGPKLPLSLSYSPLENNNVGFGIGFNFSLSYYDPENNILCLSTGERFSVSDKGDGVFEIKQQKLKNFDFKRELDGSYKITHKDGSMEFLSSRALPTIKLPVKIVSPLGYALILDWTDEHSPRLNSIKDITDNNGNIDSTGNNGNTLLFVNYYSANKTILNILPHSPEAHALTFSIGNMGHTTAIERSVLADMRLSGASASGAEPLTWTIGYDTLLGDRYWATSLTYPGGGAVTCRIGSDSNSFPDEANEVPLPCVGSFTVSGKGMDDSVISYNFRVKGDNNFLGFPVVKQWDSNVDNAFTAGTGFSYGSAQEYTYTSGDATQTTRVTRNYNCFHLITSETHETGVINNGHFSVRTTVTKNYAYDIKADTPLYGQSDTYQLPTSVTTTWQKAGQDAIRQEVVESTYDDIGNLLAQKTRIVKKARADDAGTSTPALYDKAWEYYDSKGEADNETDGTGCPAEPNGFRRFVKSMTVTPMLNGNYADSSPAKKTVYRYGLLKAPDGIDFSPIVIKEERYFTGGQLVQISHHTYAEKSNDLKNGFGRLIKTEDIYYPDGEGKAFYTSVKEYAYEVDEKDNTITCTTTATSCENISLTTRQTYSRFMGMMLESVNADGVKNRYEYDGLFRKTAETLGADTDYSITNIFEYRIDEGADFPFIVDTQRQRAADNVPITQARAYYDAAHNLVKTEINLAGAAQDDWYTLEQHQYDTMLRPLSSDFMDYQVPPLPLSCNQLAPEASKTRTIRYFYDDWGKKHHISVSVGTDVWEIHDPIAMTTLSYSAGQKSHGPVTKNSFDDGGRLYKVERYDAACDMDLPLPAPLSSVTMEYDGLDRLRKKTDELGRTTSFEYDIHGRLLTTTLSDGTQLLYEYSSYSALAWQTGISVKDKDGKVTPLGTRAFDSIGRLVGHSSGGRNWVATYDPVSGSLLNPYTVTLPDGGREAYLYIPELLGAVSCTAQIATDATDIQAAIAQSQNKQDITYCNNKTSHPQSVGNVDSLNMMLDGTKIGKLSYQYEDTGRLQTENFLYGNNLSASHTYTVAGNPDSYQDVSGDKTTMAYDEYGRLQSYSDTTTVVEMEYDDLSRMNRWRTTDSLTGTTQTTELEWDGLGREISRKQTNSHSGSGWVMTQEWNDDNRLKSKTLCRDEKIVRTEMYTYDIRNRVARVTLTGSELPLDTNGCAITGQTFTYDVLNNIIEVNSSYSDSTNDTAVYSYLSSADPCQLTTMKRSHPYYARLGEITPSYDKNGCMISDGMGRAFTYFGPVLSGRLSGATQQNGKSTAYQYDSLGRVARRNGRNDSSYYYRGDALVTIAADSGKMTRLVSGPGGNTAQVECENENHTVWLTGTDAHNSLLSRDNNTETHRFVYGPYGEHQQSQEQDNALLGYNGELEDSGSGGYLMGGNRLYRPDFRRFTSPDSLSPFGTGGVNAYSYCEGDPLNYTDPTGHSKLSHWLMNSVFVAMAVADVGLAVETGGASLALLGALVSLTSATTGMAADGLSNAHPHTANLLGKISMYSGVAATVFSLGAGMKSVVEKGMARTAEEVGSRSRVSTSRGPRREGFDPKRRVDPRLEPLHTRDPWTQSIERGGRIIKLSDYAITHGDVKRAIQQIRESGNTLPIIIITGTHGSGAGDNWMTNGLRVEKLLDHNFYVEDESFIRNQSASLLYEPVDSSSSAFQTPRDHIKRLLQKREYNIILGYCYSRNDSLVREVFCLDGVISHMFNENAYYNIWQRGYPVSMHF
ncbi:RHS repeat-associated core domain-containing protein [Serratia sp. OS31]|uniref:RHS repeat-associated core domain-containing protein n=1 Tax=Serratia sp. OS31 TaxID=2760844 RepID=UPI00160305BC|nr:RHS repeat-associated core domain-containing protein [Serratia sp. OS31]MBB1585073.1 hypothetical protein [Serratia sp. OS31]